MTTLAPRRAVVLAAAALVARRRARARQTRRPAPVTPARSHVTVISPTTPAPPPDPGDLVPVNPPCQVLGGHFPRPGMWCVYGCPDPLDDLARAGGGGR